MVLSRIQIYTASIYSLNKSPTGVVEAVKQLNVMNIEKQRGDAPYSVGKHRYCISDGKLCRACSKFCNHAIFNGRVCGGVAALWRRGGGGVRAQTDSEQRGGRGFLRQARSSSPAT